MRVNASSYRPKSLLLGVLLTGWLPAFAATAENEEKVRTVVVGLEGRRNVDEGLALAMSDVVQGEVGKDAQRQVFGRSDLQRVLSFESERQALGCNDDNCMTELAAALAVDRIVTGSIDRIGSQYFVVITEIDAHTVEPLGRVQDRLPVDENQLIDGILLLTRQLMNKTRPAAPSAEARDLKRSGKTDTSLPRSSETTSAEASQDEPIPYEPQTSEAAPPTEPTNIASAGAPGKEAGMVLVSTSPSGLEILYEEKILGLSPLEIRDLPAGASTLKVRSLDGKEIPVDVPVTKAEQTKVLAKIDIPENEGPTAQEELQQKRSDHRSCLWWKGGLISCGGASTALIGLIVGIVVPVIAVGQFVPQVGLVLGTAAFCGSCCGLAAMACHHNYSSPKLAESDARVHVLEVQPPDGEAVILELQADAATGDADHAPPVQTNDQPSEGDQGSLPVNENNPQPPEADPSDEQDEPTADASFLASGRTEVFRF